jgi:ADP-ribosyl-[dinitrogen reductase] hydrolase
MTYKVAALPDIPDDVALDRSLGALLGLAVGDALGAPVEGRDRDSYPRLADFTPGGTHGLAIGEWTDDTAMALCLAESLLARGDLDERDLLERFLRWYRLGENGCGGRAIGISAKTRGLLEEFERSQALDTATATQNEGNGCIMRLAPVAIRYRSYAEQARRAAARQAGVTHCTGVAIAAATLFAGLLVLALSTGERTRVLRAAQGCAEPALAALRRDQKTRQRSTISSAPRAADTLDAALWCVAQAESFEQAVIEAVNLGGDTDTIGAVTGQLAGALYGASAIPRRWREKLHAGERIAALAQRLHLAGA